MTFQIVLFRKTTESFLNSQLIRKIFINFCKFMVEDTPKKGKNMHNLPPYVQIECSFS